MKAFTDKVLGAFSKKLTDEVFLSIQNDKELMYDYLKLIEVHGLTVVNQQIGRSIKNRYSLANEDVREENPSSTLIQSHTRFE